jgi:hypothetical protein
LRAVFDTAEEFGSIWRTTLTEFAAWWRARAGVRLKVAGRNGQFAVRAEDRPAKYPLAVEYWRGGHVARMRLPRRGLRFSPSALAYENRTAPHTVRPVRIDPPEGLRGRIRRLIDWERETPLEEIGTDNWRNWAKRTLRRLRH